MRCKRIDTDVLVVGGGAAGIMAAISAKERGANVLVISKGSIGLSGCTPISLGSMRGAVTEDESVFSPERHFKETFQGGRLIGDRGLIRVMTSKTVEMFEKLRDSGVPLSFHSQGAYAKSSEGRSGQTLVNTLLGYAQGLGVRERNWTIVLDLLTADGTVKGVIAFDRRLKIILLIAAKTVVLATGGAGGLYLATDNPRSILGDGYALAYLTGVQLINMEFVQFLPVIYPPSVRSHPIPAWVFEEWKHVTPGILRNSKGESVLDRHGLLNREILRDNLILAIGREMLSGREIDGGIELDLTDIPESIYSSSKRTVSFMRSLRADGIDPANSTYILAPAAHYFLGGVKVDKNSETRIKGLFAAGEVAGGIHGSNRIGGNALTDALVFGEIAGKNASERSFTLAKPDIDKELALKELLSSSDISKSQVSDTLELRSSRDKIRGILSSSAGPVRERLTLEKASEELTRELTLVESSHPGFEATLPAWFETRNMILVGLMVVCSALKRTESRGCHFRRDYPFRDDLYWRVSIEVGLEEGQMMLNCRNSS
ncbi:MAG: FAD-binding protein [Candidatus Bathyarchaeota archaeon]|nr:MAG: FAD-binding protein [Candidatus Bathyarchaeota archaeon]